jgi:hypothetical protein
MAIIAVTELYESRAASINRMYERTYTRVFEVITSDDAVGGFAVRTASGIPQIGNSYHNLADPYDPLYEFDRGAFCDEVSAECIGGGEGAGIVWRVSCTYSNYIPLDVDPTLWKIKVTFSGERTERVVDFDRHGNPVINSAGDRYAEPVTVDDHITTMLIVRNELVSTYSPALASLFSDTINDATWNGFPKGYCKMGIISTSDPQYDSNSQRYYYTVTYPVSIGRKPWRKDLLDQGYNVLSGSYGAEKPIPYMVGGQPVSDPIPLDGYGHWIGEGGSPVTLTYEVFDEADWSGLNIDLSTRLGMT